MTFSQMVSVAMTSLGMVVLLAALFPTNRIVQELPQGTVRSCWISLRSEQTSIPSTPG